MLISSGETTRGLSLLGRDAKDLFLEKGKFKVNNGNQTRFWERSLDRTRTLKIKIPDSI